MVCGSFPEIQEILPSVEAAGGGGRNQRTNKLTFVAFFCVRDAFFRKEAFVRSNGVLAAINQSINRVETDGGWTDSLVGSGLRQRLERFQGIQLVTLAS